MGERIWGDMQRPPLAEGRCLRMAGAAAAAGWGVRTGATSLNMAMDKSGRAPVITVFDHRGCTAHKNTDYTGPKAKGMEDEQCVKVQSVKIAGPDADTVLRDSLATLKK